MSELSDNRRVEDELFWTEHWYIDGNYAWMFGVQHNNLCKVNLLTKEIEYIVKLPKNVNGDRQYTFITKRDDEIYILPDQADSVVIYDVTQDNFTQISLVDVPGNGRFRCTDARWIDGRLWVYSSGRKCLIVIDCLSKKIVDLYKLETFGILWDYEIGWSDNYIYIPQRNDATLLRFDISNHETKIYEYKDLCGPFRTINTFCNEIWISDKFGTILILSSEDLHVKEKIEIKSIKANEYPFISSCVAHGRIWLIPYETNEIYCVDLISKKWGKEVIDLNIISKDIGMGKFFNINYLRENQYVGVSSINGGKYYEIDTLSNKITECEYHFKNKERMLREIIDGESGIQIESRFFRLEEFIFSVEGR